MVYNEKLLCNFEMIEQFCNFVEFLGQSFVNYILLAITFTSWNLTRVGLSGYKTILKDRGWKYLVLGILEVEGNFLVIKAYQFTSVTSVQVAIFKNIFIYFCAC